MELDPNETHTLWANQLGLVHIGSAVAFAEPESGNIVVGRLARIVKDANGVGVRLHLDGPNDQYYSDVFMSGRHESHLSRHAQ